MITAGWTTERFESLFPRGIPIGAVESVGQQDVDLFKRIQVAPFVDFDSLAAVIVLIEKEPRSPAGRTSSRASSGPPGPAAERRREAAGDDDAAVTGFDPLKAGGLVLLAALVQISLAEWIEIGEAHPDVVLVTLVAVSLLRGPMYGSVRRVLGRSRARHRLVRDVRPDLAPAHRRSATRPAVSARRRPARPRTRS